MQGFLHAQPSLQMSVLDVVSQDSYQSQFSYLHLCAWSDLTVDLAEQNENRRKTESSGADDQATPSADPSDMGDAVCHPGFGPNPHYIIKAFWMGSVGSWVGVQ